ncbi:MAG: 50S ribosomal protein L10 [Phycisphaerae bacterium]|nr:50S ribosomal protein L10 [Phycisphaerae bacterium]
MSKYVKQLLQSEFEKVLGEGHGRDFMVLDLTGVNGVDNNLVRNGLRQRGVEVLTVQNGLFRRALRSLQMEAAVGLFSGPCTVAYGGDSIVDVAKEVAGWTTKVKAMRVKGAYLEGTALDGAGAVQLANMPNRKELQCQVASTVLSPGARLAGAVASPGARIAACVKTVVEKAEEAGKQAA